MIKPRFFFSGLKPRNSILFPPGEARGCAGGVAVVVAPGVWVKIRIRHDPCRKGSNFQTTFPPPPSHLTPQAERYGELEMDSGGLGKASCDDWTGELPRDGSNECESVSGGVCRGGNVSLALAGGCACTFKRTGGKKRKREYLQQRQSLSRPGRGWCRCRRWRRTSC